MQTLHKCNGIGWAAGMDLDEIGRMVDDDAGNGLGTLLMQAARYPGATRARLSIRRGGRYVTYTATASGQLARAGAVDATGAAEMDLKIYFENHGILVLHIG